MNKFVIIGSIGILLAGGAGLWALKQPVGKPPVSKTEASKPSAVGPLSAVKKAETEKIQIPPAPAAKPQEAIQEIRREIQAVMELNQTIDSIQSQRSAQMLRIQEQASIHQKILSDIQKMSEVKNAQQMPSRDALLAQEKLRIIREETLRNKKALESRRALPQKTA